MRTLISLCVALCAVGCVENASGDDFWSDDPGPGGKADGASSTLYDKEEDVVTFSLDGPMAELFTHGREIYNAKHDNDPNNDVKLVRDGTLTWTDANNKAFKIPVQFTLHGNTSLFDCDFPKLNVAFDKTHPELLKGTPFEGTRKFVIRTHCGDHPIDFRTSNYGRVSNEVSVRREAFVYKTLQILQVPSHRTRLASIHYTDGATIDVVREAFLLEDTKQMADRLGGQLADLTQMPWSSSPDTNIGLNAMASALLAESLVHNSDFILDRTGTGRLWNFEVVNVSATKQLLIPYDFDLSGFVLESGPSGTLGNVDQFGNDVVTAEVAKMVTHKQELLDTLSKYDFGKDANGAANIKTTIDSFFTLAASH